MKTIEIQNCTDNRDHLFKVFINGEKHVVRYQSKIQVADDKPFEIKAKYFLAGSPKYTFEPKDTMLLQVFASQRFWNISFGLLLSAMLLQTVTGHFFGDGLFHYISDFLVVAALIFFFIIIREKTYVIQEIQKKQNE